MSTMNNWVSLNYTWEDSAQEKKKPSDDSNPYKDALILIIDDDPTERLMARDALERAGYRVIEAVDGPDGLAKTHTEKPDFVILDIMMPVLDGFAVCDSIRHSGLTSLPILIATGLDDEKAIQRGFDLGANDFTVKPINWDTLALRIKYIMRNSITAKQASATA